MCVYDGVGHLCVCESVGVCVCKEGFRKLVH